MSKYEPTPEGIRSDGIKAMLLAAMSFVVLLAVRLG
jgi:hypothetical protein